MQKNSNQKNVNYKPILPSNVPTALGPKLTPEEMVEYFKNSIETKCQSKGIKVNFSEMTHVVFKKDLFEPIMNKLPDIINCLSNDCSIRFGTFEHEGHSYLVANFPITDVFQDPWNKQTLILSQLLSSLSTKVDYVIRRPSKVSSSYSLRFKIS